MRLLAILLNSAWWLLAVLAGLMQAATSVLVEQSLSGCMFGGLLATVPTISLISLLARASSDRFAGLGCIAVLLNLAQFVLVIGAATLIGVLAFAGEPDGLSASSSELVLISAVFGAFLLIPTVTMLAIDKHLRPPWRQNPRLAPHDWPPNPSLQRTNPGRSPGLGR